MVDTAVLQRIGVDDGGGQPRDPVQEPMLGLLGHVVAFHHRQRRIDHDLALGPQGVTDPAQPDLAEAEHALGGQQLGLDPVDQLGVDGVHQPPVDLAGGIAQHDQDRGRDEQPDQRVGEREPQRHAGSPQQHRQ